MLEPVQEKLLTALVQAARSVAIADRVPFAVAPATGNSASVVVTHPGVAPTDGTAYVPDLLVLEDAGYIRVTERTASRTFTFDVTPTGYQRIEAPTASAPPAGRKRWGRWIAADDRPWKTSAMSAVWRVYDAADPKARRALKELRYPKGRGSAAYRRLVREIETLAVGLKGTHPGIVEVLDHTVPADGDTSAPYYVMPLARESLQDAAALLKGRLEHVLEIGIGIADALAAAHDAGVIHRDIKPGNVLFFDDSETAVLCDFGICFLEDEDRLTRTEAGTVGTDDYVAPELLGGGRSEHVTRAADVYSFAKTLFAAVAGGDVFPRERWDDARFDLVTRFEDQRLAHLRGLVERMAAEDPAARPQTMAEVKELLTAAIANVRQSLPYHDGMYAGLTSPESRYTRLARLLEQPQSVARTDMVRAAIEGATQSARATAAAHATSTTNGMPVGHVHAPAATAAAAVAEDFMAAGLPLVVANDLTVFEDWLATITAPVTSHDGYHYAPERILLHPAAVLAAHAAAALAWRRRRLEILRVVVDRYTAAGGAWVHHTALGNHASALVPWMTRTLRSSPVLARADRSLADDPQPALAFVSGLVTLKWLEQADPQRMADFLARPAGPDFPITFAPGLFDLSWVKELLQIGLQGGPQERDLAAKLFDKTPAEFRTFCGAITESLSATSWQALTRLGRFGFLSLGVDPREWRRWTGVDIPN